MLFWKDYNSQGHLVKTLKANNLKLSNMKFKILNDNIIK